MKRSQLPQVANIVCMVALAVSPVATQAQTADIALVNGRIYTVDDRRSWAQAVGIRDGRFIVVGSNAEVESYIGDDTRTIDLDGRMAMPGIQDLHIHPMAATLLEMFECKFPASLTAEEVAKKVGECAASQPPGTWIRGGSYGAHLLEAVVLEAIEILPDHRVGGLAGVPQEGLVPNIARGGADGESLDAADA